MGERPSRLQRSRAELMNRVDSQWIKRQWRMRLTSRAAHHGGLYGTSEPGPGTTQTKVSTGAELNGTASSAGAKHQHGRQQAVHPRRGADTGDQEPDLGSNQTDRQELL